MPYAHRGYERLYYETRGDGPPLVLIRGLSRSLRFWTEDFLAPLAEQYRLVLFDHRGIGRSPVEDAKFTIKDMADDLATVMDAAGAERADVFGISLGGLVAQELALHHGEKIDRLVLGATFAAHRPFGPRYEMFFPLIFGSALGGPTGQKIQMKVLTTRRFARTREDIAHEWNDLLQTEPMNKKAVLRQMLAALQHNTKERVQDIRVPTLVLTGNADRLIPMQNSQYLASRIPRAQLRVLDGVGHDFPAQAPREAALAIRGFLATDA